MKRTLTIGLSLSLLLVLIPAAARGTVQKQKRKTERSAKPDREQRYAGEAGAVSSSILAKPFKKTWEYLAEGPTPFQPAVAGDRIFLALLGGRVDCLKLGTGELLWTAEFGGSITSPLTVRDESLYVMTKRVTPEGSEAGASLRRLDPATGLTVWARDFERPFISPMLVQGGRIYAGSADGHLYALSATDGTPVWRLSTSGAVQGEATLDGTHIYFGSDDGAVRGADLETGKETWKFQTGGRVVGRPSLTAACIYFGSADGYVYCVDRKTVKERWRSRTGAAVESAVSLTARSLLVGSFDNFFYSISLSNGDRIWKRRLDSRVSNPPIIVDDVALVAPLRSSRITVFLASDGRAVNFYQLDDGIEIVAPPVYSGASLLVATNEGLVALKSSDTEQP